MKIDVLLGLQWGDEGKGKIVDVLTPKYDVVARFQGGPNAGHTLEFNNIKHVLHIIPSGIFHSDKINIIGNGVIIDPIIFQKEIESIIKIVNRPIKNLFISKRAHLILPTHRILDKASEEEKGDTKIGSTQKGIGPTYMDKTARNGLTVGDIFSHDFKEKYNILIEKHKKLLKQYNFEYDLKEYEKGWMDGIELLKSFELIDNEYFINDLLKQGKTFLAEGAQGTLLDIDFGSYPFVTSSNTICAGACTGLGFSPRIIGEVYGIVKAYCTRVGSGPFPTELFDQNGEQLRKTGNEFGATTGRPRRCGWLDLPALKYSIMINGVTQLILTKADVLSGMKKIKFCTYYELNGEKTDHFPIEVNSTSKPKFIEIDAWDEDISKIRNENELPTKFKEFVAFIEKEVKVPITIISVGPNRDEIIVR